MLVSDEPDSPGRATTPAHLDHDNNVYFTLSIPARSPFHAEPREFASFANASSKSSVDGIRQSLESTPLVYVSQVGELHDEHIYSVRKSSFNDLQLDEIQNFLGNLEGVEHVERLSPKSRLSKRQF